MLFVAHSFPRASGDFAGSFVLRLARALASQGIEVTALVPHAAGLRRRDAIDGIAVHRYRYAPGSRETLAYTGTMAEQVSAGVAGKLALAALVASGSGAAAVVARRLRADVIHAHWWFPGGVAGAAASRLTGVPLVTTVHGSDVRLVRTVPGGRALLRAVVRRSTRVTAVSSWLAAEIRAAVPGADPVVAPMPADVDLFAPGDHAARTDRLLFVGRLNEQKGLGLLLRALAAASSAASLDVVGDGPDATSLRALAGTLGLSSRITWHGALGATALAALYRRAASVVMPSSNEGLGMVAVEAQLSGTPVIAFASGGLTDVIRDAHTGLLVPPGDVPALAAAIERVLTAPSLAYSLGTAGRAAALARFSPAAAAERYAALYRAAVASAAA